MFKGKVSVRIRGKTPTGEDEKWQRKYDEIDGSDSINLTPLDLKEILSESSRLIFIEISSY
jgi:hypothetical protein